MFCVALRRFFVFFLLSFFSFFVYNELLPVKVEVFLGMPVDPNGQWGQMSANALAFVGDAVFALFVRERLIAISPGSAHRLHNLSTRYVKASAQAKIAQSLMADLQEDEADVYRRGRNAKTVTMPKNAEMRDYRQATGFEALLGFLHLTGRTERLREILDKSAFIIESEHMSGGGVSEAGHMNDES